MAEAVQDADVERSVQEALAKRFKAPWKGIEVGFHFPGLAFRPAGFQYWVRAMLRRVNEAGSNRPGFPDIGVTFEVECFTRVGEKGGKRGRPGQALAHGEPGTMHNAKLADHVKNVIAGTRFGGPVRIYDVDGEEVALLKWIATRTDYAYDATDKKGGVVNPGLHQARITATAHVTGVC